MDTMMHKEKSIKQWVVVLVGILVVVIVGIAAYTVHRNDSAMMMEKSDAVMKEDGVMMQSGDIMNKGETMTDTSMMMEDK